MIILDRFEGEMAVLEIDGEITPVSRDLVPEKACEGDVLVEFAGSYQVDEESTEKRREALRTRLRRLTNRKYD